MDKNNKSNNLLDRVDELEAAADDVRQTMNLLMSLTGGSHIDHKKRDTLQFTPKELEGFASLIAYRLNCVAD